MLSPIVKNDLEELKDIITQSVRASVPCTKDQADVLIKEITESLAGWYESGCRGFHSKYCIDSKSVGFIIIKEYWNLTHLFVLPDFHRRGIGCKLIKAAIEECRTRSPRKKIQLNSSTNSVDFYEAVGFRQSSPAVDRPGGCIPFEYIF